MNIYDYLMYLGFYYSDSIFRLCYDKFMRPDLYKKILGSKKKELLAEESSQYMKVKWVSEIELNDMGLEDASETDILALNYLKTSIRFFKIYGMFTITNFLTMISFLLNSKNMKINPAKRKYFAYFIIFAVFIETPYLVTGMNRSEQKKLEEIYKEEIEKVKLFYKI
jgi:hypothetical protein